MAVSLLRNIKIQHLTVDGSNYLLTAGTTDDSNGSIVDTLGYGNVTWLVAFGDNTATGVATFKVQQSNDVGGAPDDFSDVAGSSVAVTCAAADYDYACVAIEVNNPVKRYLRLCLNRATANIVVSSVFAILGGASATPITQSASAGQFVKTVKYLDAPAEGTP